MEEVLNKIVTYLRDCYPRAEVEANTPLVGAVGNSLALMQMIMFMEREFGLQFRRADLDPDNFKTPSAIRDLVIRKRAD